MEVKDISSKVEKKVKMGIGFKLMTLSVLIILIPLLVMGFTMYNKSTKILQVNLENSSRQLISQTENSILNFLEKYEVMVESMAKSSNFKNVNTLTPELGGQLVGFNSDFRSLYTEDFYKHQMWETMSNLHELNSELQWVYLGTKKGDMFERPDGEVGAGYDPRKRGWYKAASEKKELIWTEPYSDFTTKNLVITVAAPVIGNTGGIEAVAGMDVTLDAMSSKLNEIKIGNSGIVFLIDQNSNIMTNKDPNLIGVNLSPNKEDLNAESLKSYESNSDKLLKILNGINNSESIIELNNGNYALIHTIEKFGWKMVGIINESEFSSGAQEIMLWLEIIGGIALLLALLISLAFSKGLTRKIHEMVTATAAVSNGDLTTVVGIDASDEFGLLGHYFEDAIKQLSTLIKNIQSISHDVTESAQNLAATSEETSASADEVSRTVEEIARGASEQASDAESGVIIAQNLSEKFNDLNNRSAQMIVSAKDVVEANKNGTLAVKSLKEKTEQTDLANENIESVIMELDKKTQSIGAILDSISAIAVQTNLLALNASIEAARAGEHGRGFAVVAEEIRKLAEESSSSADEIREIVTTIISDSSKTVDSMKTVRNFAKEQTKAVSNVDSSFDVTSSSIELIVSEIQEIKDSVEKLMNDKDSIVNSIGNISSVSEETAAASEEVTASMEQQTMAIEEVAKSAQHLNEIAIKLNEELSKFKV